MRRNPLQRFTFASRAAGAASAGRVVAVTGVRILAGRLIAAAQLLRLLLLLARLRLRLLAKIGKTFLGAAHHRRRVVGRGVVVVAVVLRRWLLVMVGGNVMVMEVLLVLVVLAQLVQHRHRLVRVEG